MQIALKIVNFMDLGEFSLVLKTIIEIVLNKQKNEQHLL